MSDTGAHATPPPPPPRPSYSHRRLLRFPDDGPLGGVCAGVADYLSIDPTIVRIAAVILAVTGPGIPAYILAWLIVPAADGTVVAPWSHPGARRHDRFSGALGVVLVFIAVFFLVDHWWWAPARSWFWPVALIAVGAWLLLRRHDEDDVPPPPIPPTPPTGSGGPSSPWQATPPTPPTSVVPAEPTDGVGTDTPEEHDGHDDDTLTDTLVGDTVIDGAPPGGEHPTTLGYGPPPYGGPPLHRPRRRRVLGPVVFGVLLLWGGIGWLSGVSATTGLAVGLCIVGAGFVVGAFTGGSRGLIFPALVIAVALLVTSTVSIPLNGGIGGRHDTITRMTDLHRTYELAIGERVLDLRDLALPNATTNVTIKQGIGHIEVIVPDDVTVIVDSKASAGSIELFDHEEGGTNVQIGRQDQGLEGAGTLRLHLTVGLGRIDVRRADPAIEKQSPKSETPSTAPTVPTTPSTPSTPTTIAA